MTRLSVGEHLAQPIPTAPGATPPARTAEIAVVAWTSAIPTPEARYEGPSEARLTRKLCSELRGCKRGMRQKGKFCQVALQTCRFSAGPFDQRVTIKGPAAVS